MSDHGTYAAYQRHRKAGEQPCGPCVIANREYMKGYRRRNVSQPLVAAIRAEAIADCIAAVEGLPFDFPLDDIHRGRIHKAAAIDAIKAVGND